jgi:hypothetical protein
MHLDNESKRPSKEADDMDQTSVNRNQEKWPFFNASNEQDANRE